jgi:hypothetical protein
MGQTGPIRYDPAEVPNERAPKTNRKGFGAAASILLALIGLLISAPPAVSQNTSDWITGLPREPIHGTSMAGRKESRRLLRSLRRSVGFLGTARTFDRVRLRETRMLSMRRFDNTP